MRIALLLLIAVPAFALVSPCSIPAVGPNEAFLFVGGAATFSGPPPVGTCGFEFRTTTPAVIAVEGLTFSASGFQVVVRALAPGEGILILHGFLRGGTEYTRQVAVIHVDCPESLRLQPSYTASVKSPVRIVAEVSGSLDTLQWYVNGLFASQGPSLTFEPPSTGTYLVTVYGYGLCGLLHAQSTLNVVEAPHFRAVRRR